MTTPVATCPICDGFGEYIKSELVHHGDCRHSFYCKACDSVFTTTVTGTKAARVEFFQDDAEKTDRYKALEAFVGDTGALAS